MANKFSITGIGLLSMLALGAIAQNDMTSPVGFVKLTALAASDTIVSAPLERASEFEGKVAAISGSTITVQDSPAWTANQFLYAAGTQPKTYLVRFTSGARSGAYFTVLGNTASALTIDLNGDSISTVVAGDTLSLSPYWTLGTFFPAADAGVSFEASPSAIFRKTEVLFPNLNAVGMNPSAAAIYFFYNSAWRKVGKALTSSFDDTVVIPDAYFIVRNKAFTGNLTVVGAVNTAQIQIGLNTIVTSKQDNLVAITRPVDVSLANSGLISSGAFRASTSVAIRNDELYIFDNSVAGINKSSAGTYFYYNGGWRRLGQSLTTDFGGDLAFKAGGGVVIRKGAVTIASTLNWNNTPTY